MLQFRPYRQEDDARVWRILETAFDHYPLFYVARQDFKSDAAYDAYWHAFTGVMLRASALRDLMFVGEDAGEIVCFVILQAPDAKRVSSLDYLRAGAFEILQRQGPINTLRYIAVVEATENTVRKVPGKRWHYYNLAVAPEKQGQGYGSKSFQEFVIPYVKERGGEVLTLTTNREENAALYERLGFSIIKKETMHYKGASFPNWSMQMNLCGDAER